MSTKPTLAFGRHPERGREDPAVIRAILDSQYLCHVAFTVDGWPYAVPTIYARDEERLLLHGSTLSRMAARLGEGVRVCITVTAVDGIVCARSAFNHSLNYRSVMVLGVAQPIDDPAEKLRALRGVVENVLPGRWEEVRPPSRTELKATAVLSVPLDQATAKVRQGGPVDTPADRDTEVWSGVLLWLQRAGEPVMVPDDVAHLPLPGSVRALLGTSAER